MSEHDNIYNDPSLLKHLEKTKGAEAKEEVKPKVKSTAPETIKTKSEAKDEKIKKIIKYFVICVSSIIFFYFICLVLGHPGPYGPLEIMLTKDAFYVVMFSLIIGIIVLISKFSEKTLIFWLGFIAIILAVYLIASYRIPNFDGSHPLRSMKLMSRTVGAEQFQGRALARFSIQGKKPHNLGPIVNGGTLEYWIKIPPNCEWDIKPDSARYSVKIFGKGVYNSWEVNNFPLTPEPRILITAAEDIANLKLYVWRSDRIKVLTQVQAETTMRGQEPIVVNLSSNQKVKVCEIGEGDKIYYLSAYDYISIEENNEKHTNKAKIDDIHWIRYYNIKTSNKKFPLYFQKKNNPTLVYVWIERS